MGNTDGCDGQYKCASVLYLMSVMLNFQSVIIDRDISVPGYRKEVVDGLNDVDRHYIYQFISNSELNISNIFDSHTQIHTIS